MASRLQDVILRGLAGSKPLATTVAPGTLYYSTDTFITEQSDGAVWNSYSNPSVGTGDVVGPAGAVNDNIAVFNLATGKLIKDGGTTIAAILATIPPASINQLTGDVTAGPGSGSQAALLRTALKTQTRGFSSDGGAAVLTAGIKGYISFPVACTIVGWRMLANVPGAVACELKKANFATFPTMASITGGNPPLIPATNQKAEDTVLTGWSLAIAAGDIIEGSITGVPATITRLNFFLTVVLS